MASDPNYRHALLQRLSGTALTVRAPARSPCLLWQQLRIHCGTMPLAKPPRLQPDLEINSPWQPPAGNGGFALLVAGSRPALEQARPLLDALAVQPGAWLYCGPLGAASFCRRVFDVLFYLTGPLLLQQAPGSSQPLDWPALLQQQQQLLTQLAALCRDYLQQQGAVVIGEAEQWQLLAEFQQPPAQQQHFALNLAQLLLLANNLGENARQLLETALASMRAQA